jgi:hypothetical protein
MAVSYQTEYRMGSRCVRRSYNGPTAFVAIMCDLGFRVVFDLVVTTMELLLKLVAQSLVIAMRLCRVAFHAVTFTTWLTMMIVLLPIMVVKHMIEALRTRTVGSSIDPTGGVVMKRDWGFAREV